MTGESPRLEPMPPGSVIRARYEVLNRRLAALGIHSRSRSDLSPRIDSDDWEKLVTLAEAGKDRLSGPPP
jgi:hypothetical protein